MAKSKLTTWVSSLSRSDEDEMCRVKCYDDHRAFAQIVERWEEPIRRLCTRMTGDHHRGEDLKQEAFARLFDKRKDYQPTGRFSTYLWRIALNLCHDELRRTQRRRELEPVSGDAGGADMFESFASGDPAPDIQAATNEEGEIVRQAVLQLPEIYRTVVVLRYYEHLKIGEIAEILDIPEGTANWRLAESLARLARIFEPELGANRVQDTQSQKPNKPELVL